MQKSPGQRNHGNGQHLAAGTHNTPTPAAAITRELVRREFIVDYRPGAGVRISPHFYTKDEELELIIAEMKKIRDEQTFHTTETVGAAF